MLYEVYDILAVKNLFLVMQSLTFEYIQEKRTSCEIYTPYGGARGTSQSRNGKWKFTFFKIKIVSFVVKF